jgi:hypothetical protein
MTGPRLGFPITAIPRDYGDFGDPPSPSPCIPPHPKSSQIGVGLRGSCLG